MFLYVCMGMCVLSFLKVHKLFTTMDEFCEESANPKSLAALHYVRKYCIDQTARLQVVPGDVPEARKGGGSAGKVEGMLRHGKTPNLKLSKW